MQMRNDEVIVYDDKWTAYPVNWSAIWIGALASIAVALIIGLIGIAIGAHVAETTRVGDVTFRWTSAIFCVFGAFISFVVGGWVAGQIAGIRRSEPAMLQGAIAWLVAVPILVALASLGAGSFFGGWYDGLGGTPAWGATIEHATADAEELARASATGAASGLLLALVGSVLGGWMASGEPMTFTHYRRRDAQLRQRGTAPFAGAVPSAVPGEERHAI
jgi:hypothetical protein